jgi:hypothetical protein
MDGLHVFVSPILKYLLLLLEILGLMMHVIHQPLHICSFSGKS